MKYEQPLKAKLIYVFTITDELHKGCVKIGDTTLDDSDSLDLKPNSKELNQAAKKRINQYTQTAAIDYTLLHTELTACIHKGRFVVFTDDEVRKVLKRSGIKQPNFKIENQGDEWYQCDVATAIQAINAVKEGRSSLKATEITHDKNPIIFRPEQKDAIRRTIEKFRNGKTMLWYAKMRFGKTLCALEVVKECGFKRTIIVTHRPVVDEGWFTDFYKIFGKGEGYSYGSKNKGEMFSTLEANAQKYNQYKYVYFASLQDLRGSEKAGGKIGKNDEVFNTQWDLVIVDEGHEGTQTQLGQNVLELLQKEKTKVLNLSGTPFNLLDDYKQDEIFTWDYVMEQRAKRDWDINHFGDHNPYAELPRMNIYTFDLGKVVSGYADIQDKAFNFKEFFRTWTGDPKRDHKQSLPSDANIGDFVHKKDIVHFLDLMVTYDKVSNYPFSTNEYRKAFRHSLWMVPGVKEARALSLLLQKHPIFSQFNIVNVAGDGDEDVENEEALKMVQKAMGDNPEETYSITLSCGRLTTGVTVKPWTAVMMLAGSSQTDAKAYMQTIFRVQSPYRSLSGKQKEECFVFDFAPDRTLKVIAETANISAKAGKSTSQNDRIIMGEFLNFCPIIGYNGTVMKEFNVEGMLEQLKKVYVDRVVRGGFEDAHLYNDDLLLQLSEEDLKKFRNLRKQVKTTKASHSSSDVDVNNQGLTDEEYEEVERIKKKPPRERTEEEKKRLEEAKEKKKNRDNAISILRGISIRFPLLIYGAELSNEDEDVSIENFADLIDDQSWNEFMPRGVDKAMFQDFVQYYDPDVFRAAGRKIRDMAKSADSLNPTERTKQIARIFSYFRNPDKETILTPWRVVNMHLSDCLGGWDFFDERHTGTLEEPRYVNRGEVTDSIFNDPNTHILEINSKTGLYPLYVTYSIYEASCARYRTEHPSASDIPEEVKVQLWDEVVRDNIFVICKTKMAQSITKRTLVGFRKAKTNTHAFDDLINQITNKQTELIEKINKGMLFKNFKNMKFNAIVGNPPYQEVRATDNSTATNGAFASAVYPFFIDISCMLKPQYVSLITPSRWMTKTGQGVSDCWVDQYLNSNHFRIIHDYTDASDCFSNIDIKGGVSYFLLSGDYIGPCKFYSHSHEKTTLRDEMLNANGLGIVIRDFNAISIFQKIIDIEGRFFENANFSDLVSPQHFFDKDGQLGSSWNGFLAEKNDSFPIKYYCNKRLNQKGYGWIRMEDIPKNFDSVALHKVFIPEAGGSGNDPIVLGVPFYGEPNSICSQTYICIGYDSIKHNFDKDICLNIISYIKTRLFRYLVSIKKKTQHTSSAVYQFVPLQDFSKPWTDEELYKRYKLSQEEINYIESMIKPME